MASENRRILELALESLNTKKERLEAEIADLTAQLRHVNGSIVAPSGAARKSARRSRFSRDERQRRSLRMKAYWENWRKNRNRNK